jgi:hypothetical protein
MARYSNPRMAVLIPARGVGKKTATYLIETHAEFGQQAVRITEAVKPRKLPYGVHARIVDGEHGGLYIAILTESGDIVIMHDDMKSIAERIVPGDAQYEEARALLGNATKTVEVKKCT